MNEVVYKLSTSYKVNAQIITVDRTPLLMDTLYKGHNRITLHIKDRFNGPKWTISYFHNTFWTSTERDNLFIKDNMTGPKVSFTIWRCHCVSHAVKEWVPVGVTPRLLALTTTAQLVNSDDEVLQLMMSPVTESQSHTSWVKGSHANAAVTVRLLITMLRFFVEDKSDMISRVRRFNWYTIVEVTDCVHCRKLYKWQQQ